ncbi:unnamed protein product [Vitrella brassicaformis CCMP3155]|uniref:Rad21/Rec8-like protein N-terminal domain-containing protein n=1 Tax=Vitrella brassicaformis (strain CCMP3155) TaxID=1169540 RepID=A0A0G4GHU6_VITBC|nr:unnamed protein product [Vitrella brassicaformis CCMP3155]|eukprot:CEM29315.1 unnamed protein product [Vitrella brassicaformis CCMP3155]
MLGTAEILKKKGEFARIWLAGTGGLKRKCFTKKSVEGLSLSTHCDQLMQLDRELQLRTAGVLLNGIVLIFDRQCVYLETDVLDCLYKLKTTSESAARPRKNTKKSKGGLGDGDEGSDGLPAIGGMDPTQSHGGGLIGDPDEDIFGQPPEQPPLSPRGAAGGRHSINLNDDQYEFGGPPLLGGMGMFEDEFADHQHNDLHPDGQADIPMPAGFEDFSPAGDVGVGMGVGVGEDQQSAGGQGQDQDQDQQEQQQQQQGEGMDTDQQQQQHPEHPPEEPDEAFMNPETEAAFWRDMGIAADDPLTANQQQQHEGEGDGSSGGAGGQRGRSKGTKGKRGGRKAKGGTAGAGAGGGGEEDGDTGGEGVIANSEAKRGAKGKGGKLKKVFDVDKDTMLSDEVMEGWLHDTSDITVPRKSPDESEAMLRRMYEPFLLTAGLPLGKRLQMLMFGRYVCESSDWGSGPMFRFRRYKRRPRTDKKKESWQDRDRQRRATSEGEGVGDGVPPDFPEFVADHHHHQQQEEQQEEGGLDAEGIERVRGDNAAADADAIHMDVEQQERLTDDDHEAGRRPSMAGRAGRRSSLGGMRNNNDHDLDRDIAYPHDIDVGAAYVGMDTPADLQKLFEQQDDGVDGGLGGVLGAMAGESAANAAAEGPDGHPNGYDLLTIKMRQYVEHRIPNQQQQQQHDMVGGDGGGGGRPEVRFHEVFPPGRVSRGTAALAFYHTLVLITGGDLTARQDTPYNDIYLSKTVDMEV